MSRTGWIRAILLMVGVGVVVTLAARFGFDEVLAAARRASPAQLAIYLALALGIRVVCALRWQLIHASMGMTLPLPGLLAARLAGDAAASLIPAGRVGGDPLRALLVRQRGFPGVDAGAGVALDRFLEVTGNTLAVLAYLALYSGARALPHSHLLIVTFVLILATLIATASLLRRGGRPFSFPLQRPARHLPRLRGALAAVRAIEQLLGRLLREQPRTIALGLLLTIAVEVAVVFEYQILLGAFGMPADLPTVVMVLLGGGLARAVPAPAGLGALEASGVATIGLVAGRPDLGFVVGLILRLDDTLWLLTGLGVLAGSGAARVRPFPQATIS